MEYLPTGPANQKTCMDFLNNTISDNRTDESAEGCFCKAGFVLDEDRCIHEEECGCLFEGEYFPVCITEQITQYTKFYSYSKTCLKRSLKNRQNKMRNDKW